MKKKELNLEITFIYNQIISTKRQLVFILRGFVCYEEYEKFDCDQLLLTGKIL